MGAHPSLITARRIQAKEHNQRVKELLPKDEAPSLRADFARCAIDLALEHHSALVRVTEAGEHGTAGALLRPILEAAAIGYWFVYVAPCSRILALSTSSEDNPEKDTPMLGEIVRDLVPTFPPIQRLADGLTHRGFAKWLHKYTHGGTPQLARRSPGGWQEDEVMLTLLRADLFLTLAATLETAIARHPELARYGFGYRDQLADELHTRFGGEQIPQQPHNHPAAPLLDEGCGPPFRRA